MNFIFSYGTLIDKFKSKKESAYLIDYYKIDSYGMYPALIRSEKLNSINGFVIQLNDDEFKEADKYEGYPDLYTRVEKIVYLSEKKTKKVWVYVLNEKEEK